MKINASGLFSTLTAITLSSLGSTIHAQGEEVVVVDDDYFIVNAYGTQLNITSNSWLAYDQNQNQGGLAIPTVTNNHTTLHAIGNKWSAYPLPPAEDGSPWTVNKDTVLQFDFTLNQETVKGFQAVCLDADREMTGPNGKCFVLSTSQGWVSSMMNVAQGTAVGETTSQSIPIGHFLEGPIHYLVFIQDSDGTDRTIGDSSIANIRLVDETRNTLKVEINDAVQELENVQYSYKYEGGNQDTADWLMDISEDGHGVQINGNQWKALALNEPYTVTHYTMLELDVVIADSGEIHSICLDSNLDSKEECVTMLRTQSTGNSFYDLTTEVVPGVPTHLVIPYGQIRGLGMNESEVTNYLAFVQDEDVGDKRGGRSTYSGIKIYEREEHPIHLELYGENVTVPNIQYSMTNSRSSTYVQDTIDHVQSVSGDGRSITAYGNSWKRYKFDEVWEVTPSTMLRLTFTNTNEAEAHLVCLLRDTNNAKDGRNDCFGLSGSEITSTTDSYVKVNPRTDNGETRTYDLLVGSYFTGSVYYLGFGQDNDANRIQGESTISDISIYNLPNLNIAFNDETLVIENHQQSYYSGTNSNQDTTPIREHMMEISMDGLTVTTSGNQWRAFPVVPSIPAADLGDFVVSFDYKSIERGEIAALCFEENKSLGDYDDPTLNEYNPKRCLQLNYDDPSASPQNNYIQGYEPAINESHRYVANLSKTFERFSELNYIAFVADNDQGDKSGGAWEVSNIAITTSLTSCLRDSSFQFSVTDCTIPNFLAGIKGAMTSETCGDDPLLELLALWDFKNEMQIYKKIELICKSSYETSEYDFMKTLSTDPELARQLGPEFLDGGTFLNYEDNSERVTKAGASIALSDQYSSNHLFKWPEHHALDQCDVGAAMCCWVDSRDATAPLEDNTDVCYVNMKDSAKTAHVADGYSIYGDNHAGAVNCHGFAWDTSGGSISDALKGNALFKVALANGAADGKVEQVPGAPLCGCIDRMPVVTHADCTQVTTDASPTVNIAYDSAAELFSATFDMGTISHSSCEDLKTHYKSIVGEESHLADFMDTRLVGDGNCHDAINGFLSKKGLIKSA